MSHDTAKAKIPEENPLIENFDRIKACELIVQMRLVDLIHLMSPIPYHK